MKKTLVALAPLICLFFTACGGGGDSPPPTQQTLAALPGATQDTNEAFAQLKANSDNCGAQVQANPGALLASAQPGLTGITAGGLVASSTGIIPVGGAAGALPIASALSGGGGLSSCYNGLMQALLAFKTARLQDNSLAANNPLYRYQAFQIIKSKLNQYGAGYPPAVQAQLLAGFQNGLNNALASGASPYDRSAINAAINGNFGGQIGGSGLVNAGGLGSLGGVVTQANGLPLTSGLSLYNGTGSNLAATGLGGTSFSPFAGSSIGYRGFAGSSGGGTTVDSGGEILSLQSGSTIKAATVNRLSDEFVSPAEQLVRARAIAPKPTQANRSVSVVNPFAN